MVRKPTAKQLNSKRVRKEIHEFISKVGDFVSVKSLEAALGLTHAAAYHHILVLKRERYIETKKVTEDKITTLWVRPSDAKFPDNYVDLAFGTEAKQFTEKKSHVRVVRLLDNPLPKPEEPKKKTKVHVGSGMTLFNNY